QVQLTLFFWLAWDLLKDEKFARSVLLAYSITSGLLAVADILQHPGFSETTRGADESPYVGMMAFAAVITIGLCLYTSYKHFLSKIFLLVLTFFPLVAMVRTGGRGMILGFMIGSSTYLFPYWRSKRTWIAIILVILSFVAVLYITASN